MPEMSNFNPKPAVYKWINEVEHRKRDSLKAGDQKCYKNVIEHSQSDTTSDIISSDRVIRRSFKIYFRSITSDRIIKRSF